MDKHADNSGPCHFCWRVGYLLTTHKAERWCMDCDRRLAPYKDQHGRLPSRGEFWPPGPTLLEHLGCTTREAFGFVWKYVPRLRR